METGRFQPPIEQERFGRAPDGAEGLSGSFVRAAYGATGVNQNPGESPFGSAPAQKLFTQPRLQDPLPDDTINKQDKPQAMLTAAAPS